MAIEVEASSGDYRYTTEADVATFLDSLNYAVRSDADRDGTGGDAGVVDQAILTAEAEIDTYLGGPVESFTDDTAGTSAAALLNAVAFKLSAYHLAAKRGFASGQENEFLRVREEAIATLERFAANLFGVEFPDEEDETPPAGTFRFVTIDRGNCDSDEYSSDY